MTLLFNDPAAFVQEAVEGFAAANQRWVRAVPGGVVRRQLPVEPTVAVVIGGGSGHYPAFSGLVGAGIAHGAVIGNVFASPSAEQVYNVACSCENGGGVLLSYGNYAGDVLNFDKAQERLIAEGIACRTVTVTDDVSSAPAPERDRRRGIAGDLAVFKIAGSAADAGHSLDDVVELASRANERCRSLGVAFSGCTLPGADHRLFEVQPGRMAVGMGVHGEPGIREAPMPTARELARLFVESLLDERPSSVTSVEGARVVVILNGLGAVKYEELFVVYRDVARELEQAGIRIADARVGELVTSFDMAGASLSLLWLDEELEDLWSAAAETPAFSNPSSRPVTRSRTSSGRRASKTAVTGTAAGPASEDSRVAAAFVVDALRSVRHAIDREAEALGRLDSVAGDGDHGLGMQRGTLAAHEAAEDAAAKGAGVRTTLMRAADAWANHAGGASGALWGAALRSAAGELSDASSPDTATIAAAIAAAAHAMRRTGKAQLGDKTIVDALEPFSLSFVAAADRGESAATAWREACAAAARGAEATVSMVARIGRARPHAEKSLGTPDPGATSFSIVVQAVRA
jgi:dihydroxyacetone kinase